MPKLTVRALAELMILPGYEQYRILYDQKYPKGGPGVFRAPYYAPALRGIRAYYASGRASAEIESARAALTSLGNLARRVHNERVLDSFLGSAQAERELRPQRIPRLETTIGDTDIRITFDLIAAEGDRVPHIFYNMRVVPLEEELARTTLEVVGWAMESIGMEIPTRDLELVDFANGRLHTLKRPRTRTARHAEETLRVVEVLWPQI